MSELDVFRRLGDQIVPPPFEALRETAQRRVRRARVATSVVVAATVAAVTATTVYVDRPAHRSQPAPVTPGPSARPLTYADGSTIHYGDKTVEADGRVVELDVTDDGVAFRTDDGLIWFSDGSRIDGLGALGETGPGYGDNTWPLTSRPGWMLSANSGSRLVWFEFPAPGEPEVVVYDTATRQEVARQAVRLKAGHTAVPAQLSNTYVYLFKDSVSEEMPEDTAQVRYDPATGDQTMVTEPELLEDLDADEAVRSIRLKGDGRWETAPHGFHYSDGMGQQMSLDPRKGGDGVSDLVPAGPGDMVAEDVNGRAFALETPSGYTDESRVTWVVQWLDNETVVVLNPLRQSSDLLECHLETKTCEVAASAPSGIVVPDFGTGQFIGT